MATTIEVRQFPVDSGVALPAGHTFKLEDDRELVGGSFDFRFEVDAKFQLEPEIREISFNLRLMTMTILDADSHVLAEIVDPDFATRLYEKYFPPEVRERVRARILSLVLIRAREQSQVVPVFGRREVSDTDRVVH
jgi:hypothetical protein